ncbi:hypothetical protein SCAR479_02592 [Seiridium cardinale]|uniref:Uncharacterized protein n=1 Tax=Seiridium cardinale TaxID=138064 RepID=A0ABR2Y357_9PEZI
MGRLALSAFVNSTLEISEVGRRESRAVLPDTIHVIRTDFTPESLSIGFKGKNVVISMLPVVSLADQIVVLKDATTAGVKRFLPSEYGSDSPGLLLGLWDLNLADRTAQLIDRETYPSRQSNARQIGRAMMTVLAHPDETANKLAFVKSFTTTQLEMLQAAEKATGTNMASQSPILRMNWGQKATRRWTEKPSLIPNWYDANYRRIPEEAFRAKFGMSQEQASNYAINGGGLPIRVKGVEGIIAVVVVSGLRQHGDHGVIVDVIRSNYAPTEMNMHVNHRLHIATGIELG